ncbi:MAG: SusC/RagA family TonB-linked outer membrane protein, partial [Bacteroidota bacterium]|nr:SusC/RagA family TonB-linked outer membrane protein [Bacteroidota bacterium]
MKLAILLSLVAVLDVSADVFSQSEKFSLSMKNVAMKEVLGEIEKKSNCTFFYNDGFKELDKHVSMNVKNCRLDDLLDKLFAYSTLTYRKFNNKFIVITPRCIAQTHTISGTLTDKVTGEPLPGVNIIVEGSTTGTTTNVNGKYSLDLSDPNAILVFSYLGYTTERISAAGKSIIDIQLVEVAKNLDEVVVIGYGTQRKHDVTSAVASFNATNLDERPLVRVDQALVGQMAGVQVKQTTGALGKPFSINIRGAGSISAGNEPLYVVDGFPLATAAPNKSGNYENGNPLDNLNSNDIESIMVLKDAAAAAIYGSRAANGVVLITTKSGQAGKPKISVNSYAGFAEANRKLDMLSSKEWIDRSIEMINAQWVASSTPTSIRTADQTTDQRRAILGLSAGQFNTNYMIDDRWLDPNHAGLRFIDWQNEAFRKGIIQNHQISATGGNETAKYYISGNYAHQDGMIICTDYTSYSARANVEVSASKKLKFGLNLSPTYSINNDPGVEGKDNILHQLVSYSPVQEDTVGLYPNFGNNGQYKWSNSANSPIGKLHNIVGQKTIFRTITSAFAEYQLAQGLSLKTTINLDNTDYNYKTYVPYTATNSLATRLAQTTTNTSGTAGGYKKQTFVNENTISYQTLIANKHDISLLAGASYNTDKLNNIYMTSNGGYNSNVIETLNAAT